MTDFLGFSGTQNKARISKDIKNIEMSKISISFEKLFNEISGADS